MPDSYSTLARSRVNFVSRQLFVQLPLRLLQLLTTGVSTYWRYSRLYFIGYMALVSGQRRLYTGRIEIRKVMC